MNKWLIGGGIFIIIVLGGLGFFYYSVNSGLSLEATPAVLYPDGQVNVIRSGQTIPVESEFKVEQSDTIDTQSSKAKLFLFDSIFVMIEPNTKITVSQLILDNIQLNQESGKTWNKVTKTFEVKNYGVKTPNAIASVRGTEFEVDATNNTKITLVDGFVNVEGGNSNYDLKDFGKVYVDSSSIQNIPLTQEEKEKLIENVKEIKTMMEQERIVLANRLLEQNSGLVSQTESLFGVTIDEQSFNNLFYDIDSGATTFDQLRKDADENLPFITKDFIDQFEKLSKQIKNQDEIIEKIKNN